MSPTRRHLFLAAAGLAIVPQAAAAAPVVLEGITNHHDRANGLAIASMERIELTERCATVTVRGLAGDDAATITSSSPDVVRFLHELLTHRLTAGGRPFLRHAQEGSQA